jgi:tryptophan halogenase
MWSRAARGALRRARSAAVSLGERIALFAQAAHVFQDAHDLFRTDSWLQVMLGQRLLAHGHHQAAQLMSEPQLRGALDSLRSNIARAVAGMATHESWVQGLVAAPWAAFLIELTLARGSLRPE